MTLNFDPKFWVCKVYKYQKKHIIMITKAFLELDPTKRYLLWENVWPIFTTSLNFINQTQSQQELTALNFCKRLFQHSVLWKHTTLPCSGNVNNLTLYWKCICLYLILSHDPAHVGSMIQPPRLPDRTNWNIIWFQITWHRVITFIRVMVGVAALS